MAQDGLTRTTGALVVPVQIAELDARWSEGPLPLAMPLGGATDAPTRSTYFDRRTARVLYGRPDEPRRWHAAAPQEVLADGVRVIALELVLMDDGSAARSGAILAVHLELDEPGDFTALGNLVRIKLTPHGAVPRLRTWVERDVPGVVRVDPASGRARTILYTEPTGHVLPRPPTTAAGWQDRDAWLFSLASLTTDETFARGGPAAPLLRHRTTLSGDWDALVLRDGISFVARRPLDPEDERDYLRSAPVYVRSVYLDVLMLGVIQLTALGRMADELAELETPTDDLQLLLELEEGFSRFRNEFWWQHLTQHGPGNTLLRMFLAQHDLPALAEQIGNEFADYARQASLRDAYLNERRARAEAAAETRVSRALALLTVLGVPFVVASTLTDLFPAHAASKPVAATLAVAALAAVWFLGPGREILTTSDEDDPADGRES